MLEKIATEGLKPFSSLIDSLLAPKLQRIKQWAEKRELNSRANSPSIDKLLEKYLQQLLRRICGITTIVFPQQILPLTAIYEPLYLSNQHYRYNNQRILDTEFNVNMLKEGKNYLIVDSAGMGKSTFAKHLVLEILNSTDKIPIFLELRRIAETETLLEKIASEIDATKKEVNEEILLKILNQDSFVFILDGYDEIPDQFRNKIGEQISELSFKFEQNSIVLTSRPEVTIPEICHSTSLTINPLSEEQAKSLLLRYDSIAKIDIGKKLIEQFDSVKGEFLETPLLVVLLYRTYGFNQSIATKVSTFYDEIYNALYKGHDLTKSGFSRPKVSQLDSEDFRRLLRGFSFLLTVQGKENLKSKSEAIKVIDEAISLTSINPTSPSDFLDDLLLSVPLIIKDGTEFRFIHKSLGEFFAAEFLGYYSKSRKIIESLNKSESINSFVEMFNFLSEINPDLFKRSIVLPLATEILETENFYPELILTAQIMGEIKIGLWDYEKFTRKGEKRTRIVIPHNGLGSNYFYGNLGGKLFILAITYMQINKLSSSIWKYIAKFKKCNFIDRQGLNFDSLSNFPINKWIEINDKIVIENINNTIIRAATEADLYFVQVRQRLEREYEILIIDKNLCKNFIKVIQKENETQDWLETLISK